MSTGRKIITGVVSLVAAGGLYFVTHPAVPDYRYPPGYSYMHPPEADFAPACYGNGDLGNGATCIDGAYIPAQWDMTR
jgi:hypothetical protein